MRLRIARKMDLGHVGDRRTAKDKRKWWTVYNVDQLRRAKQRLQRSWRTHRTAEPFVRDNGRPDRMLSVTPDYFAMNRVNSRLIRKGVIDKMRREGTWVP